MSINKPSAEAFLGTIKKSGLVEPERLQKALAEFAAAEGAAEDSIEIAEYLVAQGVLTKWQAEKLLQGKHKGYFLGKYRLLSLLGKGGMSSVFLAEHILMRRRCAIKVLPTKRVADSSYLARFHREAQAVAALDHPNIVRAYDVDHQTDRDAEIHFLVMEYVEGCSLQELVARDGPTDFYDAVDYIRQAALGLEHAHQAGMVHRDIKPGNLLVDPNGIVKLLDLGLARYFSNEEGTALTIAHDEKVLGTADYLAPEQALDSHTVDHRADIYSLGCTLYFLLTGHPPFTEGTLAQRLMAHQTKEPPLVERDRSDIPPSLASIVRKMMAKRQDDRYNTAAEVADVLLHWLGDNADSAWKQAHGRLFGGMRGSDTNLAQDTMTAPAAPVKKPLVMTMMSSSTEEADTEIVARKSWPTGDLATSTAKENEPELSAFFSQMQTSPAAKEALKKPTSDKLSGVAKPPVKAPAPVPPPQAAPAPTAPSFDFLGPAVATPARPAAPKSDARKSAANKPPVAAPAKPASVPPPAAPVAIAPPPAAESAGAFPNFDFVDRAPSPPPPAASAPVSQPAATATPARPLLEKLKAIQLPFAMPKLPPKMLLALAAVGIVLTALITGYVLGWFSPSTGSRARKHGKGIAKIGPWTKRAISVYGEGADYDGLQQALKDAQKYFHPRPAGPDGKPDVLTITVAEGTHDEQVVIDGSQSKNTWPDGIIVRGTGETVFTSNKAGPVFSFREVTGLVLENLTIDAAKKPVGMTMSGFVTDSRLSKLHIRNFTEAGLDLSGSQAFGTPLRIDELRCEAKSDSAVGVRIEPQKRDGATDDSNNISITKGRFYGPLAAGVSIQGNFPYKISVRESIFVKAAVGIRFLGPGRWQDFSVANNTFYQCPIGISFAVMPDSITSGLSIRRNLFVGASKGEAVVQSGYNEAAFLGMLTDPAGGLEWNWSDRAAPAAPVAGEINLFAANGKRGKAGFAFDSTDVKSPKFLAPSANSPQKTAPNPREGEQPWVGALGP